MWDVSEMRDTLKILSLQGIRKGIDVLGSGKRDALNILI